MIASKGDHGAAFRVTKDQNSTALKVSFYVYTGSEWVEVNKYLSEDQLDTWLPVAGGYDAATDTVFVWVDGARETETGVTNVAATDYDLTLGYCPETKRDSDLTFRSFRVYGKALSDAELAGETHVTNTDPSVMLWYDFDQYGYVDETPVEIDTKLEMTVYQGEAGKLPETIPAGEGKTTPVTWNGEAPAADAALGVYTVKGVLPEMEDMEVTMTIFVAPKDAIYFVDCGAADTTYFDGLTGLKNTSADQAYTAENGWGYVGDNSEASYSEKISPMESVRNVKKANTGTALTYQFDGLESGVYRVCIGYYDPWSTYSDGRPTDVIASTGETELQKTTADLRTAEGKEVVLEEVTLTETGSLTVTLDPQIKDSNTNHDVMASYLYIVKTGDVEPEPETYTVTVNTDGQGSASAEPTTAEAGATVTLTATPADGWHFVEWKSTNVTVKDDSFTMPAANVTVTAIFEEEEPVTVPVTGVTLDKNELALTVGDTAPLTATVAPENATNKNVTWTSDNKEVATVVDGKVTAVDAGTANITVTTEDGEYTATCAVTVREKPADSFTVIFMNSEEVYKSETVTSGETVAEPTEPVKEGYTFTGWYTDEACTKAYNFETPVTGNLTLYAGWEEKEPEPETWIVTFESNNGSEAATVPVKDGETVTAPPCPHQRRL